MVKINNKKHITRDGIIKNNPSGRKSYFDKYFEETSKVNGYSNFKEEGGEFFSYDYTNKDLATIFNNFAIGDKKIIKEKMTIIDFKNGDMQHFIDYIMDEYVRRDIQNTLRRRGK